MRMRFPACLSSRSQSFDSCDESVTKARKGFNVPGMVGLVIQSEANLTDAEVKPLLEIDKCVLAPDGKPNLLARHQGAAMIQQKCKDARRLMLNTFGRPVLAELERLVVELEIFKSNNRHNAREGIWKLT